MSSIPHIAFIETSSPVGLCNYLRKTDSSVWIDSIYLILLVC